MNCSYCKNTIPEENYQIHEVQCKKNTAICPNCSIMLPRSKLDEHIKENHELKNCENCGGTYEVKDFPSHPCSNPSMSCEYCEAVLPSIQLNEHKIICESRTSECPYCRKYIKNKDLSTHLALKTCSQEPSFIPLLPPSVSSMALPPLPSLSSLPPLPPKMSGYPPLNLQPYFTGPDDPEYINSVLRGDIPPPENFGGEYWNRFYSGQWPYDYQGPGNYKNSSSSSVNSEAIRYQSVPEQIPVNAKPLNVLFTINKRRKIQMKIKKQPKLFFYEYEDYHKWLQKQFE
ncbi:hypothetical protein SteCoe_21073 [Stentor coeruleus]|uniref:TRAF-type domain-containing protein n=1 Tax=Stentor coeruleus TaxID=5963 RepID=A0A1R2BQB7_9CILI|nr:hypothetical protein SteCoe_21073 [Stentor coeruleus]